MSKFAFQFPGQGSQTVGMLSELVENYEVASETFAQASEALGYDLLQVVLNGPKEDLNQTACTQPALLTASVAIWRVWQSLGGAKPEVLAGHSLGEYSALTCAGVIAFEDAVKLVELRGQLMQAAVPQGIGAMAAIIGLDNEAVIDACKQAAEDQVAAAVNFNSPGQVVIAGNKEAVERASALCKAAGAKRALPLPVSVPSHCALMKPAADKLAEALEKIEFNTPEINVINNVHVVAETNPDKIKMALVEQLYSPVRWTETVEAMAVQGVETLYEAGPGKVLSGLTKRIVKGLKGNALNDDATIKSALAEQS